MEDRYYMGEKKEKIKDKVIMIFYINIGNVSDVDVKPYVEKTKNALSSNHLFEDVVEYFIPVRDHESKLEIIVPGQDIQNEEAVLEKLENIQEMYKQILEKYETK